jgi:hypothetical protein
VISACDGGWLSSDGGVALLALVEKHVGIIDRLAGLFPDERDRKRVTHPLDSIIGGQPECCRRVAVILRSGKTPSGVEIRSHLGRPVRRRRDLPTARRTMTREASGFPSSASANLEPQKSAVNRSAVKRQSRLRPTRTDTNIKAPCIGRDKVLEDCPVHSEFAPRAGGRDSR